MKKLVVITLSAFAVFAFVMPKKVNAQVLDASFKQEVYPKTHIPKKIPAPEQFVREADVMWSKTIWRKIDLREKINHPLFYPDEGPMGTRMSLIDLLLWAIDNGELQAYKTGEINEFKLPITIKEIQERMGAKEVETMRENIETGVMEKVKYMEEAKSNQITEYLVKEVWYFDKQRSVMDVRIIGLCPIRNFYKEDDIDKEDIKRTQLFWIYMPEARRIMANHEVYNPNNDIQGLTFDDIFLKRLFSSYIVQESNVFNNRRVETYNLGVDQLLEAERIQEKIRSYELDLWQY
jgi:gliding motility associated protien GldN